MSPAGALALKLVLTPLLVGAASLAGRRWGAGFGGWLVGIPFTSGPIAFFLALGEGRAFAAAAAGGILAGAASQAAFCLAYAWSAQRLGWPLSFAAGTGAFLLATVLLANIVAPAPPLFAAVVAVLAISLALMPRVSRAAGAEATFPAWDIPARMAVATAFVVLLTAAAPALGAHLAGLLAPFPVYAAVLAIFAQRVGGAPPATAVLRGLLLGLFSFAVFFLALAQLLVAAGIALAFGIAIVAALAVQGATLVAGRRWRMA